MMMEKQPRDAYMRKAREKFETTSPAQIKALGGNAVDRLLFFTNDLSPTALKAFHSERHNVAVRLESTEPRRSMPALSGLM